MPNTNRLHLSLLATALLSAQPLIAGAEEGVGALGVKALGVGRSVFEVGYPTSNIDTAPNAPTPNALTPNAPTPNALTPNALTPNALTPNAQRPTPLPTSSLRFVVIDPVTRQPVPGGCVTIEDSSNRHSSQRLLTGIMTATPTATFDVVKWNSPSCAPTETVTIPSSALAASEAREVTLVPVVAGTSLTLHVQTAQTPQAGQPSTQPPVTDITIVVKATLLRRDNPTPATEVKVNKTGGSSQGNGLISGGHVQGVASDSAGQQHVRGEHAEIAYVIDGVLLPDTLAGRQGAIVVPSTIEKLSFLSGAYAPEYGGQTAAVLDITTVPGAKKPHADVNFEGGTYDTTNGDLTWEGPLGKQASYVFNMSASRTRNALEPQQPDNQTAHNAGSDQSYFAKFRYTPGHKDTLTLTMSSAPSTLQIGNRTGLPASYASAGQGFGFLGLRDQNGVRPDVVTDPTSPNYNGNVLGAQTLQLASQQQLGQDITQREINEFATLNYVHKLSATDTGQLSLTLLHSGQDVRNQNPTYNPLNLPVDNSIEYSPVAVRNAHHVQIAGSVNMDRGKHKFKTGFLLDDESGQESYQITADSQLSLDELAAFAPNLAPTGALQPQLDAQGNPVKDSQGNPVYVKDVNGNPVYTPTSATSPNLHVHRAGFYRAAYAQDTWKVSRKFTVNYGVRSDWYRATQNLGQSVVDTITLSPRINMSYALDPQTSLRASYNRLFNTPPLAQGAVVGAPIQPETLDQYDLSIQHQLGPNRTITLAYYIKDIHNQVDTGLLIPGSEIGLYSAVNFQIGGIHGIELAYDSAPKKGRSGLDTYLNYTYSIAKPGGLDNTGAPVPLYNDHDQRNTIGAGLAYDWASGAATGFELQYGSGLASSIVPPSTLRTPRSQVNLHANLAPRALNNRAGVNLDIVNLFDDRTVINFQSGFSGTRFQQGRRILLSVSGNF